MTVQPELTDEQRSHRVEGAARWLQDLCRGLLARLRQLVARYRLAIDEPLLSAIAEEMRLRRSADPAIPGQVYERLLAGDRRGRRAGGGYYTPAHLVDLVVERTLGPHTGRIDQLRVLDPACGGGAFLLGALRRGVPERCLVGVDRDARALEVCRLGLLLAGAGQTRLLRADSLRDDAGGEAEFDVVLGNPPWGQKGFRFPPEEAAYLRSRYHSAVGVLDPFKLFVERALELVRPGGHWGMVLPDIVLLKDQRAIRDLMLERSALEWIVHAGRAFPGVNLDAAVIIGRREAHVPSDHRVSVWHRLPEDWAERPPRTRRIAQRVFGELSGHKLNIYLTQRSLRLLRKLSGIPRLGQLFEAHEGVHTGNARAKLFLDHRVGQHTVKVIVGRDELAPFTLRWRGTWLNRDPECLDRAAGDYANLGRPEWFEQAKIVVRRTGDRVIAAYDTQGYYCSNNLFVVLPLKSMPERMLLGCVAFLNSRFTTWYFRTVQPRVGRLFAELKIQHLVDFPLPAGVESLADLRGGGLDNAVSELLGLSQSERAMVARCHRA